MATAIHSVRLQKRHSCAGGKPGAPSCIRRISLLHKLPCIRYRMHVSQFKFVPEFWLKKNGIILWKIKLDLVSKPSICYTFCLDCA